MMLGAFLASALAALAASDGSAAVPPEAPAGALHSDAAPAEVAADAPAPGQDPAAPAAPPAPAPAPDIVIVPSDGPLAEAARIAREAGEAGIPIVIESPVDVVPEAVAAPAAGDALAPAPTGPPLSEAAPVLLERLELADGWAIERLIEPSGDIVLHTVNAAGTVHGCRTVGSLLALALVEQRPAAGGEFVHLARDPSGALVSYAVGPDGEPRAVALAARAAR